MKASDLEMDISKHVLAVKLFECVGWKLYLKEKHSSKVSDKCKQTCKQKFEFYNDTCKVYLS